MNRLNQTKLFNFVVLGPFYSILTHTQAHTHARIYVRMHPLPTHTHTRTHRLLFQFWNKLLQNDKFLFFLLIYLFITESGNCLLISFPSDHWTGIMPYLQGSCLLMRIYPAYQKLLIMCSVQYWRYLICLFSFIYFIFRVLVFFYVRCFCCCCFWHAFFICESFCESHGAMQRKLVVINTTANRSKLFIILYCIFNCAWSAGWETYRL
jgi:hypothetical protein